MGRTAVEISASPGGSGGQSRLLPDDQDSQDRNRTVRLCVHVNWMAGLKLLRWLRKFCERSGPQHQTTSDINITEPQQWFMLCRVKSQYLKMLQVDAANNR
jgi:hypothetical protein